MAAAGAAMALDSILGVGSTIGQLALGHRANQIEQGNLNLQGEVLDYNKALQKQIFSREDTSVQRRVNDLKEAGLNPILAAGQGARAGATIPVTAPQRDTKGLGMMQGPLGQLFGAFSDISKTVAEIALINAQKDNTAAKTNTEWMRAGTMGTQQALNQANVRKINAEIVRIEGLTKLQQSQTSELVQRIAINEDMRESRLTSSKMAADIATWQEGLTQNELRHSNMFIAAVEEEIKKSGFEASPEYQKWLALKLQNDIKTMDVEAYKALQTSPAAAKLVTQILRILMINPG